jgi:hypothetical protein
MFSAAHGHDVALADGSGKGTTACRGAPFGSDQGVLRREASQEKENRHDLARDLG